MRFLLCLILLAATASASVQETTAQGLPPPPPSIALSPAPLSKEASVALVVDTIPPTAKYVTHAQMKLDGVTLDPQHAAEAGAGLSEAFAQLFELARAQGANLIVLFSNERGVDLPIRECATPLRLRAMNPIVTAVLFHCETNVESQPPPSVRFTTKQIQGATERIRYSVDLVKDTAGISKAYWTYANISRFVADACEHHFDTVTVENTDDAQFEEVCLPGCDEPVRISRSQPKLAVTIYKAAAPLQKTDQHR